MAPFDALPAPGPGPAAVAHAPRLSDFGLSAPLTDRQAEVLIKLLDHTYTTLRIGYVALNSEFPPLSVLARMGLASCSRERVGRIGPDARTLTVWRLSPRGLTLAWALKHGDLCTAEIASWRAANDRSAA